MADIYSDLPLGKDGLATRVLDISPGQFDDPLRCRLRVKQLMGASCFEALSYTWSEDDRPSVRDCAIIVNRKLCYVTRNLEAALRRLRRPDSRRRVWVDAVCINQDDMDERASQVMQMGQIYRNADRVIIWLGEGDRNTDLAMRYIRWSSTNQTTTFEDTTKECCPLHYAHLYYHGPKVGLEMSGFTCSACEVYCECGNCRGVRDSIRSGLDVIANHRWWSRVWVVQEVAMAAGDPLVQCGAYTIPWSQLVRFEITYREWPGKRQAIRNLHDIRTDVKLPPRLRESLAVIPYSGEAAVADDVFQWLRKTSMLTASDPRDKIYALLGMARSKRWRDFRPDYELTPADLIRKLVLDLIVFDGNLDILTLANPCDATLGAAQRHGGFESLDCPEGRADPLADGSRPSWMPDFMVEGLPYLATMNHIDEKSSLRSAMEQLRNLAPPLTSASGPSTPSLPSVPTCFAEESDFEAHQALALPYLAITAHGYCIDRVAEMSPVHTFLSRLHLIGNDLDRPKLRIVPWMSLWYWYPVWRGLDPAFFHLDEQYTLQAFHADLTACFECEKPLDQYLCVHKDDLLPTTELETLLLKPAHALRGASALKSPMERSGLTAKIKEAREVMGEYRERVHKYISRTIEALEEAMHARRFFVTEHGLLGIGPRDLRAGDKVAFLRGSSASFVLRQHDDYHVLVGNVYVDIPADHCPWQLEKSTLDTGALSTPLLSERMPRARVTRPETSSPAADMELWKRKPREACPPAATWTPIVARCEVFEIH